LLNGTTVIIETPVLDWRGKDYLKGREVLKSKRHEKNDREKEHMEPSEFDNKTNPLGRKKKGPQGDWHSDHTTRGEGSGDPARGYPNRDEKEDEQWCGARVGGHGWENYVIKELLGGEKINPGRWGTGGGGNENQEERANWHMERNELKRVKSNKKKRSMEKTPAVFDEKKGSGGERPLLRGGGRKGRSGGKRVEYLVPFDKRSVDATWHKKTEILWREQVEKARGESSGGVKGGVPKERT